MALIALTIFALAVGQSLAYPLGWGPGGGDWAYWGNYWGDDWCGGSRWCGNWGFGGFGYPPSKTYARENYVRPSWNGPEFGTRNEVTYRPGYYGGPYSASYSWYNPYNAYVGYGYDTWPRPDASWYY